MNNKEKQRDALIKELWLTFRDMTDTIAIEDMTDEDLALWGMLSSHSSVRKALHNKDKARMN